MHDEQLDTTQYQDAKPGDRVTFGVYPQTAAGTDRTPITWRVLRHTGAELLLLSEYILDCKRYHGAYTATTWRDCDVRQWLNAAFYPAAFTAAEQALIQPTLCIDHGVDSPDTQDRVFLLSAAEVMQLTDALGKDFRRTVGTAFARVPKTDGCHLYVMDKNVAVDYLEVDGRKVGCSWWWLRDQGQLKDTGPDPSRAVFIGTRASIRHYARVDRTGYGVRPALKLALS